MHIFLYDNSMTNGFYHIERRASRDLLNLARVIDRTAERNPKISCLFWKDKCCACTNKKYMQSCLKQKIHNYTKKITKKCDY